MLLSEMGESRGKSKLRDIEDKSSNGRTSCLQQLKTIIDMQKHLELYNQIMYF